MTTLLIISTHLFIGIMAFLIMFIAFLLWVLRVVLKSEPGFLSDKECIEFAQSVTNHEVTIYDFDQWYSNNRKKVRFSDN